MRKAAACYNSIAYRQVNTQTSLQTGKMLKLAGVKNLKQR